MQNQSRSQINSRIRCRHDRVVYWLWAPFLVWAFLALGCASSDRVIPETLESQVDKSVAFDQLKDSPDSYRGRLIVLGGEVLAAKRLKDGTQLEILQLPLEDGEPVGERVQSHGRFLAIQREFLDPATVTDGRRVTVVGEVQEDTIQRLDETDYRYPTLEVKHLRFWENQRGFDGQSGPWWGIYGGVGIGGGSRGGVGIGVGF